MRPRFVLGGLRPDRMVPLAIVIVMIAWHRPWRTAIKIPWRRVPEHVN